MSPDDPRHGTTAGAKQHRKHGEETCQPCKAAATLYQNQRELDRLNGRPRAVSAVGVARRIQGLMYLGYTYPVLAPMLGVSTAQVHKWARGWQTITRASSRSRVGEVFERLCMSPMPDGRNAKYARTVARRNGWVSPLAWDDIDDPDEQPDLGERATHRTGGRAETQQRRAQDRLEDVEHLAAGGVSGDQIAQRLDLSPEALEKFLERQGRRDLWTRIRPGDDNNNSHVNRHGLLAKKDAA
jgi:hypothetical protein